MNKPSLEELKAELQDIADTAAVYGESQDRTHSAIGRALDTVQALLDETDKKARMEAYDQGYDDGENAKPPKLVDAIQFRQEQYGWSDTKMAAMLDLSKSHYSEFKNGKRGLPINSIRKAYAIGIVATVLLQDDIDRQLALTDPEEENDERS